VFNSSPAFITLESDETRLILDLRDLPLPVGTGDAVEIGLGAGGSCKGAAALLLPASSGKEILTGEVFLRSLFDGLMVCDFAAGILVVKRDELSLSRERFPGLIPALAFRARIPCSRDISSAASSGCKLPFRDAMYPESSVGENMRWIDPLAISWDFVEIQSFALLNTDFF
jgi:hypothetical protein